MAGSAPLKARFAYKHLTLWFKLLIVEKLDHNHNHSYIGRKIIRSNAVFSLTEFKWWDHCVDV